MPDENTRLTLQQIRAGNPQAEKIISEYAAGEEIKKSLLHFVEWLKTKGISPLYTDFEEQDPFWEIECGGKKHYIVWNGGNNICVMVKAALSNEFQTVVNENNLQDMVLDNLTYCSRSAGGHCGNCHLPPDVAGLDCVVFGKEERNLCCGQFITFENPTAEGIEGIKRLMAL
jgi:hypothetical protein